MAQRKGRPLTGRRRRAASNGETSKAGPAVVERAQDWLHLKSSQHWEKYGGLGAWFWLRAMAGVTLASSGPSPAAASTALRAVTRQGCEGEREGRRTEGRQIGF